MTTTSTLNGGTPFVCLTGNLLGPPEPALLVQAADSYLSTAAPSWVIGLFGAYHNDNAGIGIPTNYPSNILAFSKLNNVSVVAPIAVAALHQLLTAAS